MPLLRILVICATFTLSVSCSDDNDGDSPTLKGDWVANYLSSADCDDPDFDFIFDNPSSTPCTASSPSPCIYWKINFAETTYRITVFSSDAGQTFEEITDGTYTVDGNQITACDIDNDCGVATFTLTSNTLKLVEPDDEDGCDTDIRLDRL